MSRAVLRMWWGKKFSLGVLTDKIKRDSKPPCAEPLKPQLQDGRPQGHPVIMINEDGAYHKHGGKMGFNMIAQNKSGMILGASASPWKGNDILELKEALAFMLASI
ncbi:hypothetical protein U1Q18_010335 [Sarracenia purpurea var. burkii]